MRRKRSGILWEIQQRTKKKCTPATDGSRLLRREKQWKCSAYKCKDFPGRDFPGRDFHARDLKGQHSSLACSSMFCGLCKRSWDILLPRHRAKGSFLPENCKRVPSALPRDIVRSGFVCAELLPKKERSGRSHFFQGWKSWPNYRWCMGVFLTSFLWLSWYRGSWVERVSKLSKDCVSGGVLVLRMPEQSLAYRYFAILLCCLLRVSLQLGYMDPYLWILLILSYCTSSIEKFLTTFYHTT